MRRIHFSIAVFAIAFGLTSCCSLIHTIHERISKGQEVVSDWRQKYCQTHIRCPNQQESARFRSLFQAKIEKYIADHPEFIENKKSELRGSSPLIAMTKTEMSFFVNDPFERIKNPEELAKRAQQFWAELK